MDKNGKSRYVNILLYIILSLGAIGVIFPFVWMFLSSLKTPEEIMALPPTILPKIPSFDNYVNVWNTLKFGVYFKNSLFITVTIVLIQLYSSSLIGYVLEKIEFRGRKLIFYLIISCMMIPWPVTIIPLYQEMSWFHWVNTYKAVIIPFCVSIFGVFMIKQFASSIPNELIEAARIDGAQEFNIFHKIIMPALSAPMAALAILQFMWNWDNFLWPFLMLMDDSKYTIPIGLSMFSSQWQFDYASVLAGGMIAIIPVLIVYIFFQRKFIEGIALTGIK